VPGLPVPDKYLRNYQSVPQPGLDGRSSPIYTGAVVGGGTVVNGMFFSMFTIDDALLFEHILIALPICSRSGLSRRL
jgi:hypothetical protein